VIFFPGAVEGLTVSQKICPNQTQILGCLMCHDHEEHFELVIDNQNPPSFMRIAACIFTDGCGGARARMGSHK
jgi:hypothetical protein